MKKIFLTFVFILFSTGAMAKDISNKELLKEIKILKDEIADIKSNLGIEETNHSNDWLLSLPKHATWGECVSQGYDSRLSLKESIDHKEMCDNTYYKNGGHK